MPGHIDVGTKIRHDRGELVDIIVGSIIKGAFVKDHRVIDRLLRKETINYQQHQVAQDFYRDWYLVRDHVTAIDLEHDHGGNPYISDAYVERYVRYSRAMRALPYGNTLVVTTGVCLEDRPINYYGTSGMAKKRTKASLLAGLDILEEFY